MIKEFALDPQVLAQPGNIRYFLDQFDIHKGRLIAEYPKRWASDVYRIAAKGLRPVELKRFQVQLEMLDRKLTPHDPARKFDKTTKDWLENAETVQSDGISPFDAIVANENPRSHSDVLVADEVDETNEKWAVARQLCAARTSADCVAAASRLLDLSREIILVDPYFDATQSKWKRMLKAMVVHTANNGLQKSRIELHCCERYGSSQHFWQDCRDELPSWLPRGVEIIVRRWREKPSGERFHRRYLLTERGGLAFEGGLDEGKQNETTDIYLLEESLRQKRWPEYQQGSNVYDIDSAGPVTIRGTRRN
ncbi:hypothetical protein [Stieleria mannarensis]|uniref:hypothetical protein n=1 Tax=Stieleria mannarensis TaxID=2755585 RepID=UPI0016030689|nr:hypothetical protein [Rhodopirellula sp. JC639]